MVRQTTYAVTASQFKVQTIYILYEFIQKSIFFPIHLDTYTWYYCNSINFFHDFLITYKVYKQTIPTTIATPQREGAAAQDSPLWAGIAHPDSGELHDYDGNKLYNVAMGFFTSIFRCLYLYSVST